MIPKRRQSLHGDLDKEPKDSEVIQCCDKCGENFLVCGQTQTKLDKDEIKEYLNLCEKKNVYPNLAEEAPFMCQSCSELCSTSVDPCSTFVAGLKQWYNERKIDWVESPASATGSCCWVVAAVLPLVIILAAYAFIGHFYNRDYRIDDGESVAVNDVLRSPSEVAFDNSFDILEHKYSLQEERTWYTLSAGVKAVSRDHQPSVFLMLYVDKAGAKTSECLAKDVSKEATKFLKGRVTQPLIIQGNQLDDAELKAEPGKLLVKYEDLLETRGVMIVKELQNVPPNVAKSFHFMCDKYSPLVKEAVYFFTLQVSSLPSKKEVHKFTESRLRELWSGSLEDSIVEPLITRLTPSIVKIYSESSDC